MSLFLWVICLKGKDQDKKNTNGSESLSSCHSWQGGAQVFSWPQAAVAAQSPPSSPQVQSTLVKRACKACNSERGPIAEGLQNCRQCRGRYSDPGRASLLLLILATTMNKRQEARSGSRLFPFSSKTAPPAHAVSGAENGHRPPLSPLSVPKR